MDPNLPATTEQTAVPATTEQGAVPATVGAPEARPARRPRQNITTGLYPLALGVLVVIFLALGLWTLMATTGGSGL
jgi:hypothetical protein